MNELVIRGGTVVDGSGAAGYRADVAVSGGRIAEIDSRLEGAQTLDASGCIVAPGFIDIHTHYDAQVFWDPALSSSCWHGVTSVVAGNCGFTIAPTRPEHRGTIIRTLQAVEDMSAAVLEAGIPWDFVSFAEYLDSIERRGVVLNFGCYVGHSAVRMYAMGDAGYERSASEDEIARMRAVVAESMRAGALGFSTSFSASHNGDDKRPVPSRRASIAEVESLASVLGELGRGVVVYAPGSPLGYAESYALARRTGRPWMWTPMITNYPEPDYTDAMRAHAAGRASGAEVLAQVSCRPVTVQFVLSNPYLFGSAPSFNDLMRLPEPERRARLRDAAWRARAFPEIAAHVRPAPDWRQFSVAETRAHMPLIGRDLASLAAERGGTPLDVLIDLSLAENLATRFLVKLSNYEEDGVAEILRQPGVVLGQSDAGAHLSSLCDASMPTDLLGGWVRERGVLPLERAVRMLSAELAELFELRGRGYVRPGYAADLVVFDAATISPGAVRRVWDLPGGEDRLVADQPAGIRHTLVNGTPIWRDGKSLLAGLGERPGRVLRSGAGAAVA